MNEQFRGLTMAYLGTNAAHREFRTALANGKARTYILALNRIDGCRMVSFQIKTGVNT